MTSQLYLGDCLDVFPTLPDNSVDSVVTDPPYGDTSLDWDRKVDGWLVHARRVLKPNGSLWAFGSMRFLVPLFLEAERLGFKYSQDVVWEKQNGTGFHNDRFRRVHEHAVMFYLGKWGDVYRDVQYTMDARAKTVRRKTKPTHTRAIACADASLYVSEDGGPRLMRSVQRVANEHGRAVHPTQKPLDILSPLIAYSCPPGGVVLDPFAGSGSTGVAALQSGRQFIGIERELEYWLIAHARLSAIDTSVSTG